MLTGGVALSAPLLVRFRVLGQAKYPRPSDPAGVCLFRRCGYDARGRTFADKMKIGARAMVVAKHWRGGSSLGAARGVARRASGTATPACLADRARTCRRGPQEQADCTIRSRIGADRQPGLSASPSPFIRGVPVRTLKESSTSQGQIQASCPMGTPAWGSLNHLPERCEITEGTATIVHVP